MVPLMLISRLVTSVPFGSSIRSVSDAPGLKVMS